MTDTRTMKPRNLKAGMRIKHLGLWARVIYTQRMDSTPPRFRVDLADHGNVAGEVIYVNADDDVEILTSAAIEPPRPILNGELTVKFDLHGDDIQQVMDEIVVRLQGSGLWPRPGRPLGESRPLYEPSLAHRDRSNDKPSPEGVEITAVTISFPNHTTGPLPA